MRKLIKVSSEHIKKGTPVGGRLCPIALALKDAGFTDVDVDDESIQATKDGLFIYTGTPKRAATFVRKFDNEKKVAPFNFYLEYELEEECVSVN
jgi:hypothetical protein